MMILRHHGESSAKSLFESLSGLLFRGLRLCDHCAHPEEFVRRAVVGLCVDRNTGGSSYTAYYSRVGDAGGRPIAVVFDDITERKRRPMVRTQRERPALLPAVSCRC